MNDGKKKRVFLVVAALFSVLSLAVVVWIKMTDNHVDIKSHLSDKVYASYSYGESNTVYVGTQPLYAPTGLITEAMRRDVVLREELRRLG